MIINKMKDLGITKEDVLRNVDFAFMTEEEQDEELRKQEKELKNKILNFIIGKIKKDSETEGE